MTFKYFKNCDIDKLKWDHFIENSCFPQVYATSWFLDIVTPGWGAFISNDWDWVMPVPVKRKYCIPYVIQPMFTQQLGIFSKHEISPYLVTEVINQLIKKFPFVVYQFSRQVPTPKIKGVVYRQTYELKLNSDYQIIQSGYNDSHKKNIRRAERNDCSIQESQDVSIMVDLMQQMYASMQIDSVKGYHYKMLSDIFKLGLQSTESRLYYAFNSCNEPIAGTFFLNYKNQNVIFSARTHEGFEKKATFLLVDHFIRENASKDVYLDFAGSDIKGIAEFNSGWGATKQIYCQLKKRWF